MEERGVPVQDDWSIAPDDDKVRFSLSGVMPHSWGERSKHQSNTLEERGQGGGPGRGEIGAGRGLGEAEIGAGRQEATCRGRASSSSHRFCAALTLSGCLRGGGGGGKHILPEAQQLLEPHKDRSSGDTGHPAAVTREHPRFPQDYKQLSF